MKKANCIKCYKLLNRDEIALCKKTLGRQVVQLMCITCLAEYLDCAEDDLAVKIEEFKEQGCELFR